mgnify:CR=1 FL=1
MLKLKMYPNKAKVENTLPSSSEFLSANKNITELIKTLAPDLIVGNKEENEKNSICVLQQEFPV